MTSKAIIPGRRRRAPIVRAFVLSAAQALRTDRKSVV